MALQHVDEEGPGLIATAMRERGVTLEVVAMDEPLPAPADLDCLVVLGGPMAAYDGTPRMSEERALIAGAVEAGVPVLGVCLGAQLLASALGARVYPGDAGPEEGLGSVELTPAGREDPVLRGLGDTLAVVHWHGDTFDLPPGAAHLARSERYPQQAYRVGARAYGLQFHVEVDDALWGGWRDRLERGPADAVALQASLPARREIVERFVALAGGVGVAGL